MIETMLPRRSLLRATAAAGAAIAVSPAPTASAARRLRWLGPVDPATPRDVLPLGAPAQGTLPRLVFSDEFNGRSLDPAKWNVRDQDRGTGNHGVDWWYRPKTVRVADGALAIDIARTGANTYAGGRIDSLGKFDFTFGSIEYRVHVPPTIGHLAAVWLMATNGTLPGGVADGTARDGAEIDIMETFSTADEYSITIHWDGEGLQHQESSTIAPAPGLHTGPWWHVIGLHWSPAEMVFTYDGQPVRVVDDPKLISQVKEFPVISHEISAFAEGDIHNAPLNQRSTMYVDYVRVWQ